MRSSNVRVRIAVDPEPVAQEKAVRALGLLALWSVRRVQRLASERKAARHTATVVELATYKTQCGEN